MSNSTQRYPSSAPAPGRFRALYNFRRLAALLSSQERRQALRLLALMAGLALFEVIGVTAVVPFLAVVGDPEIVHTNPHLNWFHQAVGEPELIPFLRILGVGALILLVASSGFRAGSYYILARFANGRRHSIGRKLLAVHLSRPYEFFLQRNSADLSKTILSEVDQLVANVIRPSLLLVSHVLVLIAIATLVAIVDVRMAIWAGALLLGVYGIIYGLVRNHLDKIGRDRIVVNRERFKAVAEMLTGIKEVKLSGSETRFLSVFDGPSVRFTRYQAANEVLSVVPKYIVEGVGFGALILVALIILGSGSDWGRALPLFGMYAMAGYRLLPAMQNIYGASTRLRFGMSAVDAVYADLEGNEVVPVSESTRQKRLHGPSLKLHEELVLSEVSYHYPGADAGVRDISLRVPAHSIVGVTGPSGAGKSTLVDLLLGLLEPQSGRIKCDSVVLTHQNRPLWQASVGYVPQELFLLDASLAENIGFGVPKAEIDEDQLNAAAKAAQIHQFILDLPDGYDTTVGEQGVKLSGGQRQRVAIARALYRDPVILVLDEATSALDDDTEQRVLSSIQELRAERTVIMVAHRSSTLQICDEVFRLENGTVTQSSTVGGTAA